MKSASLLFLALLLPTPAQADESRWPEWLKQPAEKFQKWRGERRKARFARREAKWEKAQAERADRALKEPAFTKLQGAPLAADGRVDRSKMSRLELHKLITQAEGEIASQVKGKQGMFIWDYTELVDKTLEKSGIKDPYVVCEIQRLSYHYQGGRKHMCDVDSGEQKYCVYWDASEDEAYDTPRCEDYDALEWNEYAKLMKEGRRKYFNLPKPYYEVEEEERKAKEAPQERNDGDASGAQ